MRMSKLGLLPAALCLVFAVGSARAGETIRVVLSQTPWGESLKLVIPDFEKETGIKVEAEHYGDEQILQKLSVEFAAGRSTVDVFMTRPPQDAKMMLRNGWYEDLTPYFKDDADYDIGDYFDTSIRATRFDGFQTSIPVNNECEVMFYRKDLFEKAGLKIPDTMAEVEAAAKKLTDRPNEIYGFLARGMQNPLITQFSSFLYGFGADWFDQKTMTATVNTPEALAAIDFFGRMQRLYAPPGATNISWPQCLAIFQQGKAAMFFDSCNMYRQLTDPAASKVWDKTGTAIFPAGPAGRKMYVSHGYGIAIYKQSAHKQAAWKFIRYMTDKKRTVLLQGEYANPCSRKSAYQDPAGVKKFPADWVKAVNDSTQYGVGYDRPMVTAVAEARDMIGAAVVKSIEGGDYKAAADRANQQFQELLNREKGK